MGDRMFLGLRYRHALLDQNAAESLAQLYRATLLGDVST